MLVRRTSETGFAEYINALTQPFSTAEDTELRQRVEVICRDVANRGDTAVVEYTNRFDRRRLVNAEELRVPVEDIEEAYRSIHSDVIAALELAAERISAYHKAMMPKDVDYTDGLGVRLGNVWKPVQRVGMYVPGGLASYPSSVLMNAVPAKVAGVEELVMTVPAPDGVLNPVVLAAARIAGVTQIYTAGGAQAIAALALGTSALPRVDKIVGPGNAYVAAAKRYFYGQVGIDMVAGPSEILVVADAKNNPNWIAADLLSQAEHDADARSLLITDNEGFAGQVVQSVEKILATLPRATIARKSWEKHGAVMVVRNWDEAVMLIDRIAPEHLELALEDTQAEEMLRRLKHAGAVFLGRYTPEAMGDYIAGPSHVLPTSGTARFSSGLSVYDFLKRVSVIGCTQGSFSALAPATARLADEEGLGAHALSVRIRTNHG